MCGRRAKEDPRGIVSPTAFNGTTLRSVYNKIGSAPVAADPILVRVSVSATTQYGLFIRIVCCTAPTSQIQQLLSKNLLCRSLKAYI